MGAGATTPTSAPLASNRPVTAPDGTALGVWVNGDQITTFPFAVGTQFNLTSGYGNRVHPIYGDVRFHAGIDLAAAPGTPIRTIAGGRVVRVGNTDPNGYGNVVAVQTPDGLIEHYAHLNSMSVQVGETIQAGTVIGTVGNTGGSTGPHLDFSVWNSIDTLYGRDKATATIDPLIYMRGTRNYVATPLGTGPAPSYNASESPDPNNRNLFDLYRSYYQYEPNRVRTGATLSSPDSTFNSAAPQRSARAALHRNAYGGNDVEHNYGYSIVSEDREYRAALVRTANNLNIPAQWLADVIDYETAGSHAPYQENRFGCVGMLQACGTVTSFGTPGAIDDFAQAWGVSAAAARTRLAGMSRARQLESWQWWLAKYSDNGARLNTIEDLYALVNQGPSGLTNSNRNNVRDVNGTLLQHVRKLGNNAGRRYETSADRLQSSVGHIHETPHPGCPECNRMASYFGKVLPHTDPTV